VRLKKLLIVLLLLSFPAKAGVVSETRQKLWECQLYFPDELMQGYDKYFGIQEFLELRNCFLKDEMVGDISFSEFLENQCAKRDINQRILICAMVYEHSIFEGSINGKYWVYGDGKRTPLKRVKNIIMGVSGGSVKTAKKYRGIKKQLTLAPKILRAEMDSWKRGIKIKVDHNGKTVVPRTKSAYALFRYSPYSCKVQKMKVIYSIYFPQELVKWGKGSI
jgi:hypothetical protein